MSSGCCPGGPGQVWVHVIGEVPVLWLALQVSKLFQVHLLILLLKISLVILAL